MDESGTRRPDATAFTSLRRVTTTREERWAMGRAMRQQVPRSEFAGWSAPNDRVDPVRRVAAANQGRIAALVPIRIGRMAASPYAFLRGAAAVHAADFAQLPATGIQPVICGDAHLSNFGFYASPERALVFDLNDFDEAHPGPWEWDLRRMLTSVWVAGRQNGSTEDECHTAVHGCVRAYQDQLTHLADEPLIARSYERVDVDSLRDSATDKGLLAEIERAAKRARRRTSDRALPRFTEESEGQRRIVEEPPLITHVPDDEAEIAAALDEYLGTLPLHWARILGGYRIVDIAQKVVGVGSVGLRAYVALCEGGDPDDVVFLQLKQARRSVVAQYVHGEAARHAHQGQRVVEYQQALQTVSDPLLGWATVAGRDFYVRQFRDMKGAITVDGIDAGALADYAGVCGHLLAKGHARTKGASMIAGYIGSSDALADALADFAREYADQTERDHEALVAAVEHGELPAESER